MKILIFVAVLIAAVTGDVSHLPLSKYLPPSHHHHNTTASAPAVRISAASSYHVEAASAPAVSYSAPTTQTYHVEAASTPAVSYSATATQSYHEAASAPAPAVTYTAAAPVVSAPAIQSYHKEAASAPAIHHSVTAAASQSYHVEGASAPALSYSAPATKSYQVAASTPAPDSQTYDFASSAPTDSYSAPAAQSYQVESASAPDVSYLAPAASYESAASEPAHAFSASEGYRYKTAKRRVIRRQRRDVSHLPSNDYLPPNQGDASDPSIEYLPPAAASVPVAQHESAVTYSVAASSPPVSNFEPATSNETSSYDTDASEPAHSYSSAEGYRYKTAKRRVIRRQRRDVSHLSSEYLAPHQDAASVPSDEYLPPAAVSAPVAQYESAPSYDEAAPAVSSETPSSDVAASEPAHSYSSAEGYRYKTAKRSVIRRQRRDVSHLTSKYLAPHQEATSVPSVEYLPPAAASATVAQNESAPSYDETASSVSSETPSNDVTASEPAHSYSSAEGYRYKTAKRRVIRRQRRDVSHLSREYLAPHQDAASVPSDKYLPPAAASAPVAQNESAPSYDETAPSVFSETPSFDVAASEPAHSYSSAVGYRYKTAKRRVIRRQRRDVSHLSSEYLPPHQEAVSVPSVDYLAPAAASAPVAQYESAPSYDEAAPAVSSETPSSDVAASEPAHSYSSAEGYRYKTAKRRVIRRQRRDVSHLSSEYLPPHQEAASVPSVDYFAPAAASAPVAQYESAPSYDEAAPAVSSETPSFDVAASEPAHSYSSAEGYRYKTAKRRVIRRQRRDVSHLSREYLAPHQDAASVPSDKYLPPAAASAPVAQNESAPSYDETAPSVFSETPSFDVAASEPAHSYSSAVGYRYKTAKRRVIRRQRRDVSHLSSEYLPPHQEAVSVPSVDYLAPAAASAPVAQYESAPSYDEAAPAVSSETPSSDVAASEPAHSYSSAEGYSYKTAKRRVIRRQRRDVSHLSSEYLPPHQEADSAPSVEYLPPVAASAPVAQHESAQSYDEAAPAESYETPSDDVAASEPAHSYSSAEGYRYKTAKRRVIRRQRRDVSHLSSEYLPPHQEANSVPSVDYLAPRAASAPVAQYVSAPSYDEAAPAVSSETRSSDVGASEPAHSYSSAEGYRYKTAKRRVIRRQRRDVSHLSSEYLPPHQEADSAPSVEYLPPVAASAPVAQYESAPSYDEAAPAESYETPSDDVAASEPAHSYSSAEGYRYKTAKQRVVRRHRF